MTDVRLKTIALGYMRAYGRVQEVHGKAYSSLPSTALDTQLVEDGWAALFEALNWLDAFQLRPEVTALMDPELRKALMFVRGRVHHRFMDAVEFRADVRLELGPTVSGRIIRGPLIVADWCWVDAANLGTGWRDAEGAYKKRLAGRQVRAALDDVASLAGQLFSGMA